LPRARKRERERRRAREFFFFSSSLLSSSLYLDRLAVRVLEAEVADGVGQRAAHEELGGEVEDVLGVGGAVFFVRACARGESR
jgi:hypothetical protein